MPSHLRALIASARSLGTESRRGAHSIVARTVPSRAAFLVSTIACRARSLLSGAVARRSAEPIAGDNRLRRTEISPPAGSRSRCANQPITKALTQGSSHARAAVDHRVAGGRPAIGGAGVAVDGARSGSPPVRAPRLPRLDPQPRHPRHIHRSRPAQGDGLQPTGHAGPTLARAPASTGGSHGHHPIRDNRRGSPGLRHHRGCNSVADRCSFSGREDGNSLRLRRLLPDSSAVATPRATPIAALNEDAGPRNG